MRGLYEPIPIQDVFFSDLGAVEEVEGCLRFYLYVLQSPSGTEGEPEKVIVAKLVTPASAHALLVCKTLAALGLAQAKITRAPSAEVVH